MNTYRGTILFGLALSVLSGCGDGGTAPSPIANTEQNVVVFDRAPSEGGEGQRAADTEAARVRSIQRLVAGLFDLSTGSEYSGARVRDASDHLVVYLLKHDTWQAEAVRVDVDESLTATAVQRDYDDASEAQGDGLLGAWGNCPDANVDALVSTDSPFLPTALHAVNTVYTTLTNAGYVTRKLTGTQESATAIKSYLGCPGLKFWARIGHGSWNAILLAEGSLTHAYVRGQGPSSLTGKTLYMNSGMSHNEPLHAAVLSTGVQKYIGVDIYPLVGPSERVLECWIDAVINRHQPMTTSLVQTCRGRSEGLAISGNGSDTFPAP